jgi:4-hydroxy-tetrahydrodipicolinate synthase
MRPILSGVSAAVLTPRSADGNLNLPELRRELEFLIERGITSFTFNGATGEFPLTTPADMASMLSAAGETAAGHAEFFVAIGAASHQTAIKLGTIAKESGAKAVLLAMPYFFRYAQDDLDAYSRDVAASMARIDMPVLLYNLPQFSSGLEPATTLELIRTCDNIVGIKDSSGSLDTLRLLTASGVPCTRVVGYDAVIADAVREGLCDGVISGVACALPELILAVHQAALGQDGILIDQLKANLNAFLDQMNTLPFPWGLKAVSNARHIMESTYSQPVSSQRQSQLKEFEIWFAQSRQMLLVS